MIRVAHLDGDPRSVVSISIQPADWQPNPQAIASVTANIGDIFQGGVFTPPPAPNTTIEQWAAMAQGKIEAAYGGKRVSLASYYTFLARIDLRGALSDEQKADLAVLDAAQHWEQAVLDAGATASRLGANPSSFEWPKPPVSLAELVTLS